MRVWISIAAFVGVLAVAALNGTLAGEETSDKDLAHQIFETMLKAPGVQPGHRLVHAKGLACRGSFEPSADARKLSKASHFAGPSVPVTVRFSDGSADPMIPDGSPHAGTQGMAVRFHLPGDAEVDIVANSHNGFIVSNGREFLALQKAIVATDPAKPHPWPIEEFLGSHPTAMKFVKDAAVVPASFATQAFFGNHAFVLVNPDGARQPVRFQIIPMAGEHFLGEEEAKAKPADFLFEDLKTQLAKGPVKYRLLVQLANPGDPTIDPSVVWPQDRKTVEVGVISVVSVVPDAAAAERALAFDPTNLTDGIELSDDPFPQLRSSVYALSVKHRRQK